MTQLIASPKGKIQLDFETRSGFYNENSCLDPKNPLLFWTFKDMAILSRIENKNVIILI